MLFRSAVDVQAEEGGGVGPVGGSGVCGLVADGVDAGEEAGDLIVGVRDSRLAINMGLASRIFVA